VDTSFRDVFHYSSEGFQQWQSKANSELMISKINHGIRIGKQFVFDTLLEGLYFVDMQCKLPSNLH